MKHRTSKQAVSTSEREDTIVVGDSTLTRSSQWLADSAVAVSRLVYSDGVYVLECTTLIGTDTHYVGVGCRDTQNYPALDVPNGGYPVVPAAAFADDTFSTDALVLAGRACRWMRQVVEAML